jgi:hypothetical protein
MRISLTQRSLQSFPNKRERLGRNLGDNHEQNFAKSNRDRGYDGLDKQTEFAGNVLLEMIASR